MEALTTEITVLERLCSFAIEAFVIRIPTTLATTLTFFLFATGCLPNNSGAHPRSPAVLERMLPTGPCTKKPETEDASEDEDDDADEEEGESEGEGEDEPANEDGGEGEDGDEGDPDNRADANGSAGSGEDDEDEDEDEEDDEEEEDEDEEIQEPPSKKRK